MARKSSAKKTTNTAKTIAKTNKSSKAANANSKPTTSSAVKSAPAKSNVVPAKKAAPTRRTSSTKSNVVSVKKSTPQTKVSVQEEAVATHEATAAHHDTVPGTATAKAVRVRKVYLLTLLVIIILGFALYYYRSVFVAAVVNGQPISRLSIVQAAEKQSGKQALDTQVRNILIEQEAKKEGVTVSDQEVNDQMKSVQAKLASQGQNIDQVLAMQGMTKNDLRNLMRLDKLVQKMVGKNIKVTDKQVDDYISQNQASLPQNQDQNKLRQSVKAQLQQQALQQQVQSWLTNLQSKAKIIYFVQY